jgi:uncharacterized protein DUF262
MTAPGPEPEELLDPEESIGLDADDLDVLDEADPEPEPVTYSGSDFDVDGLVRRQKRGDIVIPTFGHEGEPPIETAGFQRSFVWRRPQMDRFIESLLLGYPIPGIFLVQQTDKRYLVLDGQQRLRTLVAFYEGIHDGREFALQSVAEEFRGLTYRTLSDEQRRTLDNTFIYATIVRSDGTPDSLDAVYQIFERLNAGGTQLTPHEIRVALYAGPFIDLLTSLNAQDAWRSLYGPESPRLRDQEIILRFIALYVSPGNYRRPLKKYLNDFVALHRTTKSLPTEIIRERFSLATDLLLSGPGSPAIRGKGRQVNAALTEAILVGLARRLDTGNAPEPDAVTGAVAELLSDPLLENAISRATADEESVRSRLALSTQAFAQI